MRSCFILLILLPLVGCSRDQPFFGTGDAEPFGPQGDGGVASPRLVTPRADAGTPRPDCDNACETAALCAAESCVAGASADTLTKGCQAACQADDDFAEAVAGLECPELVELVDGRSSLWSAECQGEESPVCAGYGEAIAGCLVQLCASLAAERGQIGVAFETACHEALANRSLNEAGATATISAGCGHRAIAPGLQAYADEVHAEACAAGRELAPSGLTIDQCARACGNIVPCPGTSVEGKPELCQEQCEARPGDAWFYFCSVGATTCDQMNGCLAGADACGKACAHYSTCAGGPDCAGVSPDTQFDAAYTPCQEACAANPAVETVIGEETPNGCAGILAGVGTVASALARICEP